MTVTQITPVTGSRSKVYLDDEFAFVLYKGELRRYKLEEGADICDKVYSEIQSILNKRAKLRSMALLKSRPYTEKQMCDKLRQGFYPETAIKEAVDYLKSYGYINDAGYVAAYLDYHKETKSRRRMEQDLITKGIDRELIAAVFAEWEGDGGEVDETEQIARWIRKKSYDIHTADFKEKQKMLSFLYRKGFDSSKIRKALQCEDIF